MVLGNTVDDIDTFVYIHTYIHTYYVLQGDFCDLAKFTEFLYHKMFSPKRYRTDFELNHKIFFRNIFLLCGMNVCCHEGLFKCPYVNLL